MCIKAKRQTWKTRSNNQATMKIWESKIINKGSTTDQRCINNARIFVHLRACCWWQDAPTAELREAQVSRHPITFNIFNAFTKIEIYRHVNAANARYTWAHVCSVDLRLTLLTAYYNSSALAIVSWCSQYIYIYINIYTCMSCNWVGRVSWPRSGYHTAQLSLCPWAEAQSIPAIFCQHFLSCGLADSPALICDKQVSAPSQGHLWKADRPWQSFW